MISKRKLFTVRIVKKSGTLDVTVPVLGDRCGWEYGWRDVARGAEAPWIEFRIGKLMAIYFERFKHGGFEAWFMGFWMIK